MKTNFFYFSLLFVLSQCLSISLRNSPKELSCQDVSDILKELSDMQAKIDDIRKSFLQSVQVYARADSKKDDKKIEQLRNDLVKIVLEDISRVKILSQVFLEIESSLKEVAIKSCKKKAEEAIQKVKSTMTAFIQEMKKEVKRIDNDGRLAKNLSLIQLA